MINIKISGYLAITAIFLLIISACRKDDQVSTDSSLLLRFSNDSVIFDTVFTSLGSATQTLIVYNQNDVGLKLSSIRIAGGSASYFRANADGLPVEVADDIEIGGGDSIFIFLRVTINPNDQNNPFVVEDELLFSLNGNQQIVKLVAWGQNANYILADTQIEGFPPFKIVADSLQETIWTSEKPYVVYGFALIDSYGKLIIEEGTQVYLHDGSGIWAYVDGVLEVNGSLEAPVIFQGDRLESFYDDLPGQWDRIWLMEGREGFNHSINYAIIRNGFIGLQVESFLRPTENQLNLTNTIIENMSGIGLFTRTFAILGTNNQISNCGNYCVALTGGGVYDLRHQTIANYWTFSARNTPAFFFNNFLLDSLDQAIPIPMNLKLGNSIVYGFNNVELGRELAGGADSTYDISYNFLKMNPEPGNAFFSNNTFNEDPLFLNREEADYQLDTLSPAIDRASPEIAAPVPLDIKGVNRLPDPDPGAYEFTLEDG